MIFFFRFVIMVHCPLLSLPYYERILIFVDNCLLHTRTQDGGEGCELEDFLEIYEDINLEPLDFFLFGFDSVLKFLKYIPWILLSERSDHTIWIRRNLKVLMVWRCWAKWVIWVNSQFVFHICFWNFQGRNFLESFLSWKMSDDYSTLCWLPSRHWKRVVKELKAFVLADGRLEKPQDLPSCIGFRPIENDYFVEFSVRICCVFILKNTNLVVIQFKFYFQNNSKLNENLINPFNHIFFF